MNIDFAERKISARLVSSCLAVMIATVLVVFPVGLRGQGAGELEPSIANRALDLGGIPQPSMKSLANIDRGTPLDPDDAPFIIDEPGSYYLTGNITDIPATEPVITINSNDVTLDLRGFAVQASGVSGGTTPAESAINIPNSERSERFRRQSRWWRRPVRFCLRSQYRLDQVRSGLEQPAPG